MIYYAIGDIHGMHRQLEDMLAKIERDARGREHKIIFLGDYVDRGPESKRVIETVMSMTEQGHVALKGNHEDMMLQAYDENNLNGYIGSWWCSNGGHQTMESYGVRLRPYEYADDVMINLLPKKHIDWMRNLPLYFETDTHIYVHAGLQPGLTVKQHLVDDDYRQNMMRIRHEFLGSNHDWGKKVVHGHTVKQLVDQKHNRIGIDTGAVFYGILTCLAVDNGREYFLQVEGPDRDEYQI